MCSLHAVSWDIKVQLAQHSCCSAVVGMTVPQVSAVNDGLCEADLGLQSFSNVSHL